MSAPQPKHFLRFQLCNNLGAPMGVEMEQQVPLAFENVKLTGVRGLAGKQVVVANPGESAPDTFLVYELPDGVECWVPINSALRDSRWKICGYRRDIPKVDRPKLVTQ